MKVDLRGKFIAVSAHFRKIEQAQINNLMRNLKVLEKQQQTSTNSKSKREITEQKSMKWRQKKYKNQ